MNSFFKILGGFSFLAVLLSGCQSNSMGSSSTNTITSSQDNIDNKTIKTGYGTPQNSIGQNGDAYIDLSTYDYYIKENDSWILKGNLKGSDGKTAYDIYLEYHPEYTGTEEEWLEDLINGRLGDKTIHTVSFNSNGGSDVPSQQVIHGEKAVRPNEPHKNGYQFVDWVDEYNDHWVFNGFSVTSDIELNAVWSETIPFSKLKINEICSKNRKSFTDKYGETSDWIELYNSSNVALNLKGCGLSNDKDEPYSLLFDDVIINPDEYMVIAVSGRSSKLFNGEYHAPFTLSQKKSGTIVLSAPYGLISEVTYPALKDDISFGLLGDEYEMLKPSAGRNNEEVYTEKQVLPSPSFSKPSGLYNEEFDLTLSSNEGYHIYYTIDSSTPTETSLPYNGPIHIYDKTNEPNIIASRNDICGSYNPYTPSSPISKCMVVRAICYDDYGNYSAVSSSSYWISQNDFIKKNIPLVSVSTDFDNLFDYEKGIYCNGKVWDDWASSSEYDPSIPYYNQPGNYSMKGFDWERKANLTFLNEKQKVKCEQLVGVRIKGGSSRGNSKKSFNVYSRFLYDGNSKFDYKFNGKKCEGITLRSGGNNTHFMVTDPINAMIAKKYDLNFETQDSTPTYLYLNGEYWGLYFITDKYDSKFIEEKYQIDDAIMCKCMEIEEGYMTDLSFIESAKNTINEEILTEEGYETFASNFELSNLIDMILFQSYIDTFDFDLFYFNSEYWRSRLIDEKIAKSDGLLRFMLYDTDLSLGVIYEPDHYPRLFERIESSNSLKWLFQSEQFVNLVCERGNEIISMLSSEDCINNVVQYYESLTNLIEQNNLRFFGAKEAGQTNKYDLMINHLQNRGQYFATFLEDLASSLN